MRRNAANSQFPVQGQASTRIAGLDDILVPAVVAACHGRQPLPGGKQVGRS
jgi:hypothetical protein